MSISKCVAIGWLTKYQRAASFPIVSIKSLKVKELPERFDILNSFPSLIKRTICIIKTTSWSFE